MKITPTVFLVDDDSAVRDALGLFLETAGLVVESYASAQTFIETYTPDRPGCLVLDFRMPNMNGLELQKALAANGINLPIIFISGHGDVSISVQAVKAGAIDFLEKPFPHQLLLDRIAEAIATDARVRRQEAEQKAVKSDFAQLTPREREIMLLVVKGRSNKDIASQLQVSRRTVETHRARIMEKMHAASLPDLVTMAVVCGIHQATY